MWRSVCVLSCTLLVISSGTGDADTCTDYLGSQCQNQAVQEVVCKDTASAPQFCAKTCGLCPTTKPSTASTTTEITTLTSVKPTSACADTSIQCNDRNVLTAVCKDKNTAVQLCAKSCGMCSSQSTSRITSSTKATITMPTGKSTMTTTMSTVKKTMSTTMPTVKTTWTATMPTVKKTMSTTMPTVKTTLTTTMPTVKTTIDNTLTSPLPTTVLSMNTVQGMCKDKLPDCRDYGDKAYACSGKYQTWAKSNCAQYCGYCANQFTSTKVTTTIPTVMSRVTTYKTTEKTTTDNTLTSPLPTTVLSMNTVQGMCKDKLPDCRDYGDKAYACSGKYQTWAKSNCAQYCGYCGNTLSNTQMTTSSYLTTIPTSTTNTCTDSAETSCTDPDIREFVCSDPVTANMCPKTCGKCVEPCHDDPDTNCLDPDVRYFVCSDKDTASKLCPKTCNICNKQSFRVPLVG